MQTVGRLESQLGSPLLLRRIARKSVVSMAHMTIVTTPGEKPEMHDQDDDATRYDQD